MSQEGPYHPGDLVRQRHDGNVPVLGLQQLEQPWRLYPLTGRDGASAVDNHRAQVRITSLANAEQPYPTAGATLPRNDTEPGGKLPAGTKPPLGTVTTDRLNRRYRMLGYAAPSREPWRSLMRHFLIPGTVAALPGRMMSGTAARALIARSRPTQRLTTAHSRTLSGAVDVAMIATPADAHLHRATATVVEPVARLRQTPHDPSPTHWTAAGETGIKGLPITPATGAEHRGPGGSTPIKRPGPSSFVLRA